VPLTRTETGWTILPQAPLAGHLHLHSDDLSWLCPILDSNLQSGGRLNLDADLIGTLEYPRLQGEAQGDALSLAFLNQGIRLEQGELKARFDSDAVHIDRLVFSAPYLASPRDSLFADYSLPAGTGRLSAIGADRSERRQQRSANHCGALAIDSTCRPLDHRFRHGAWPVIPIKY